MPEEGLISRYKAKLLALSERNVLVRKAKKFELPSSNTFSVIAKKRWRTPHPGQIGLKT